MKYSSYTQGYNPNPRPSTLTNFSLMSVKQVFDVFPQYIRSNRILKYRSQCSLVFLVHSNL